MREAGYLTVSDKPAVARLPVREVRAALLPVGEGRLVAPVVQPRHRAQVRFGADVGPHRAAFLPGGQGPPRVVRVGQDIRAETAIGVLCLLQYGDSGGE